MKKNLLTLVAALCMGAMAHADEGMWMLSNVSGKSMKIMQDLGLELSKKELYNPGGKSLKDAVVNFGGFCSGVIVSESGLVFTNHHCGYGNIQALATPQNDILEHGFVAHTQADELPAKGLYVRLLQRTDDVTERILKVVDKKVTPLRSYFTPTGVLMEGRRNEVIDSMCSVVEREYEKKYPGTVCEVETYFQGNEFYVNVYKQYDDVRLVFAPPQSLGKFGGETDNWMWPRQTCDFSVFRIYANKQNEPAEYSPTNRPYKPVRHAKVSMRGFEKGDYCMTIGYPGSTNRYLSSFGITEEMENGNLSRINVRGVKQEVWKKWMESDPAIRLKYASKYAQSSNYWKNSIGMNKALKELGVVEQKQQKEDRLEQWIAAKASRKAEYGAVMKNLRHAYSQRKAQDKAMCFMNETFLGGSDVLRIAAYVRTMQGVTDSARRELYKTQITKMFKDTDINVDKETTVALLDNYAKEMQPKFLPGVYTTIKEQFGGDCKAYVDWLFAHTALTDVKCLEQVDSISATDDAAMQCITSVMDLRNSLREEVRNANMAIVANERKLCKAIVEMEMDKPHYSDANFTMRLSYGFVNDYTSAAGHQDFYTTMGSLLDKVAQSEEIKDYVMEDEIKALFERGDFGPYKDKRSGQMQLCFLTNNDITGGNSGSPMFNGKGELIGLAFDGNWDAMSSDISFTQDLTRCIGVDIRYVLYIIDKWGGASRIIGELDKN